MANCLYYKNNPIGIVQSNADDVLYGGGLSVKDKIDSLTAVTKGSASLHSDIASIASGTINWTKKGNIVYVSYNLNFSSDPTSVAFFTQELPPAQFSEIGEDWNWVTFINLNDSTAKRVCIDTNLNNARLRNYYGQYVTKGTYNGLFCYISRY